METQTPRLKHFSGANLRLFVGSRWFFVALLVLFVLQALWIAISNKYPLAFDESYHYGIIQLHAKQWSPFFAAQPDGGNAYGALTREPSYLFHYLMSFPYRVLHAINPSLAFEILSMRFMNIAMFAGGIVLFRKLLLELKLTKLQAHLLLAFVVLLPMAPFIAANINYDNMLIPLVALTLLLTVRIVKRLKEGQPVTVLSLLQLLSVCTLSSLVKFSYLPIFVGVGLSVVALAIWYRKQLSFDFTRLKSITGVALIAATLLGMGLFVERYGYNMAVYHAPNPECHLVLPAQSCRAYGVWARSETLSALPHPAASWQRFKQFNYVWVALLSNGMFSVVDADHNGIVLPPVKIVMAVTLGVVGAGAFLALMYRRQLAPYMPMLAVMLVIVGCYLAALWFQTYKYFNDLGIPIAIQARYLMPILPVLAIIPVLGISVAFKNRPRLHYAWAVPLTIMFIVGGGVSTYILRSNDTWYWNDGVTASLNSAFRNVLEVVVD